MNLKAKKKKKLRYTQKKTQTTLYSAFIDLLDSSEIDLDAHDKETAKPDINVVVKIY